MGGSGFTREEQRYSVEEGSELSTHYVKSTTGPKTRERRNSEENQKHKVFVTVLFGYEVLTFVKILGRSGI